MTQNKPASAKTFERFVKRCREIHGDRFEYFPEEFYGVHRKVKLLDTVTGKVLYQYAGSHLAGNLPKELRPAGEPWRQRIVEKWDDNEAIVKQILEWHPDITDVVVEENRGANSIVSFCCPVHDKRFQRTFTDMKKNSGCPLCKKFKDFVNKCREVHGDRFQYFPEEFHGVHYETKILDTVTGKVFYQMAKKHNQGSFPQELRDIELSAKQEALIKWTEEKIIEQVHEWHPHLQDIKVTTDEGAGLNSRVSFYCPIHKESFQRSFKLISESSGCLICNVTTQDENSKDETSDRMVARYQDVKRSYRKKWIPKGYYFIYYPYESYYPFIKFKDVVTGIIYEQHFIKHKKQLPEGFVKYTENPSLDALFEVFAKNSSILYEDRYEYSRKSFKGFHKPTEARDKVTGVLYTIDPVEHYYGRSPGLLDHPTKEIEDTIKKTFPNLTKISFKLRDRVLRYHCTLDDTEIISLNGKTLMVESDECLCKTCAQKRHKTLLPKPKHLSMLEKSKAEELREHVRKINGDRLSLRYRHLLAKGQGLSLLFDKRSRVAFYYDVEELLKGYPKALDNLVPKNLAPINLPTKAQLTPQPVFLEAFSEVPLKPSYFRVSTTYEVGMYAFSKQIQSVLSPHKILFLPAGRPVISQIPFERYLKELRCTVDDSNPGFYTSTENDFRIWLACPPQSYSPIEGYELTTVTAYNYVTKTEIGALAYRRWIKTLNQPLIIDAPLAEEQKEASIEHIETFMAVNDLCQYEYKKGKCTYTYKDFYTTDAENIRFVLVLENETNTVVRVYFDLDRQFPAAAIQKAAKSLEVECYIHDLNIGSGVVPKSFGHVLEEIPTKVWVSEGFEYAIEDSSLSVKEFQDEYGVPRLSGESDEAYMRKLGYTQAKFQPKIRILL